MKPRNIRSPFAWRVPALALATVLTASVQAHPGTYGSATHEHVLADDDQVVYPNGTVYHVFTPHDNSGTITIVMPKSGSGAICQGTGDYAHVVHRDKCKELLAEAVDSGEPTTPGEEDPPKDSEPAGSQPPPAPKPDEKPDEAKDQSRSLSQMLRAGRRVPGEGKMILLFKNGQVRVAKR